MACGYIAWEGKESYVGRAFRDFVHSKAKATILLNMSGMILPKKSSSSYPFSRYLKRSMYNNLNGEFMGEPKDT